MDENFCHLFKNFDKRHISTSEKTKRLIFTVLVNSMYVGIYVLFLHCFEKIIFSFHDSISILQIRPLPLVLKSLPDTATTTSTTTKD